MSSAAKLAARLQGPPEEPDDTDASTEPPPRVRGKVSTGSRGGDPLANANRPTSTAAKLAKQMAYRP